MGITRLNVPALMSRDSFRIASALHATRHTPFTVGHKYCSSGKCDRLFNATPYTSSLHPSFSCSLVLCSLVDATRHTPQVIHKTLDNLRTSSLNTLNTSFKYISFDLSFSFCATRHALYELALQAASRPIDEKCLYSGRVYDWSSRRIPLQIWLSVRLLAIPVRVLALSSAFIYNKNLWVKSDLVERNSTQISFKNICTHVIIHTPYSSKEPSQRFARQHASTPAHCKHVPLCCQCRTSLFPSHCSPLPGLLLLESPLSRTPAFADKLSFPTAFRRMRSTLTPKVNLSEQGRLPWSGLHYAGAALVDHVVLKGVKVETQADYTMLPQALAFVPTLNQPIPLGCESSIPHPFKYMFLSCSVPGLASCLPLPLFSLCVVSLVERNSMVKIQIVNHGVDTFVINAHYMDALGRPCKRELPESFAAQLDEWKKYAQGEHEPYATPLEFRHAALHMHPNGAGRGQWQWMLKTDDITLYISRGKWNGIASVRLNSRFLWSCSTLTDAIVQVNELLFTIFEKTMLYLQASNIDLCADVAGWSDVEQLDKKLNFVSRSRKRKDHSEGEQLLEMKADGFSSGLHDTGFDFSVKSSPVHITMYDKSRELQSSGKSWFKELWRLHDWDEETSPDVWRVEAKFKREALHEIKQGDALHGIEDAYEIEQYLPLLWAYAVGHVGGGDDGLPDGWLRCVLPSSDKNRARWPTHPVWEVLQTAYHTPNQAPAHFGKIIRQAHEQHNIEKALEAIVGYSSSLSAWVGGALADPDTDFSVFLHWLANNVPDLLERKEKDFAREVQRKLIKLYRQPLGNAPAGEVPNSSDLDIA
jgi:hypothetical protein